MKTKILTGFTASIMALTGSVVAHTGEEEFGHHSMMGGMMSGTYGFGSFGMWLYGWIFSLLVLAALVLFIAWLVKQIQKK